MRIVLLANHALALPAIDYLARQNNLAGVALSQQPATSSQPIEAKVAQYNLPLLTVTRADLPNVLREWIHTLQADVVFVIGFPYRLPAELFTSTRLGAINFHGGLLPEYRGPDPVFWLLKGGAAQGGITVHQMDATFDTGPILLRKSLPVIPGETYGIHISRLGELMPIVLAETLTLLNQPDLPLTPQTTTSAQYHPRPTLHDLTIHWATQSAREIENLINASNPAHGGALTYLKGNPIRILEVTPANVGGSVNTPPGTIVYADQNQGAFVSCIGNEFLRINIVSCNEGILTSYKLSAMGLKAGDLLYTPAEGLPAVTKPIQHH